MPKSRDGCCRKKLTRIQAKLSDIYIVFAVPDLLRDSPLFSFELALDPDDLCFQKNFHADKSIGFNFLFAYFLQRYHLVTLRRANFIAEVRIVFIIYDVAQVGRYGSAFLGTMRPSLVIV